jgi:SHAQKYF class myb-like DNA-binding protein
MEVITTFETTFAQLSTSSTSKSESEVSNGRWTKEEHERFVEAIKLHGKNWKKVEETVGTRTGAQIRSHAQKFFLKVEKEIKTNQKSKGNKDQGKSNKKYISALENLTALIKTEDNLKGNLSFNEINENLTEASEISTVLPASPNTHLVSAEKSIEYVSNTATTTPTKLNDMQSESSDYSQMSKYQLLSKLKACEEKVGEYHSIVQQFTASHTNTSTSNHYRTESSKPYHHFVYLDLMNYFTIFNKNAKSLKLSDMVDLSFKTNVSSSEESYVDAPAGKKKVRIL